MKKGQLLLKTEVRQYRMENSAELLLLIVIFLLFVALSIILYATITPYNKRGLGLIVFCSMAIGFMSFFAYINKFQNKFLEIYENGFIPIEKGILDFFLRRENFIEYSSIVRVEERKNMPAMNVDPWTGRKKNWNLHHIVVYTKLGISTNVNSYNIGDTSIEKLIESLKYYFRQKEEQVTWVEGVSNRFAQLLLCRKFKREAKESLSERV
ncbi:MAG: hypothetical protein QMC80_07395 [Thermoplasmatales archaeon]|nr:hypothetical protein [Thermoplasmatales archaeon]